jgi:quercetin dioxygenase-like cupin family protein
MVNYLGESIARKDTLMNLIRKDEAPTFTMPGLTVTGLASPKRGAREISVWTLSLAPGTPGVMHSVTREEVFVGVRGTAVLNLGGAEHAVGPGDAVIVPPATAFSLANQSTEVFQAVVSQPVGGKAIVEGDAFTPPWAE